MSLKVLGFDLLFGVSLPDVAHDAAAVTEAMDVQDKNGKRDDLGRWRDGLGWRRGRFMQQWHGPPSYLRDEHRARWIFLLATTDRQQVHAAIA